MELSADKQGVADVYRTETFQRAIRPAHEARLQHMPPEQRTRARSEHAIMVGFGGLLALLTDMRQHRRPNDNRRSAQPYWSPLAHGWVFH